MTKYTLLILLLLIWIAPVWLTPYIFIYNPCGLESVPLQINALDGPVLD